MAKLRALAITEGALQGKVGQPAKEDLGRVSKAIRQGQSWESIFPGVASLETTTSGFGPAIDLRLSKKEGLDVRLVPEGTPGAVVMAVKRVDELGFYSLGHAQLAEKVDLTAPKATAMVWHLNIKADKECFKEVVIGKSTTFQRYSVKAVEKIREALAAVDPDQIWQDYRSRNK